MDVKQLGCNDYFINHFDAYKDIGTVAGRVIAKQVSSYKVITRKQTYSAKLSGKFRYHTNQSSQYPSVGDWVVFEKKTANTYSSRQCCREKAVL